MCEVKQLCFVYKRLNLARLVLTESAVCYETKNAAFDSVVQPNKEETKQTMVSILQCASNSFTK